MAASRVKFGLTHPFNKRSASTILMSTFAVRYDYLSAILQLLTVKAGKPAY